MSTVSVFLADDHPLVRSGLRSLVLAQPDMTVAGEAGDGEATVRGVLATQPDVVVMDVSMPKLSGHDATLRLRAEGSKARIVALTAHEDRGYLQQMMAAGAVGYVLKRSAAEGLVSAIRAVATGQTYIDPAVSGEQVSTLGGDAAPPSIDLSEREVAVLRALARGHAVKDIATSLELGVRTIETYKTRGMEKLGLKSRADLVRHAVKLGWLT